MRIAIDANGGDLGLKPNIEGAILADKNLNHNIYLVGRDPEIREELRRLNAKPSDRFHIVHAPDIVEMHKEPVDECRTKPNSSLMVAADLVKDGKADAFISAGNTGATMVASLLRIKRIKGIIRPAIGVPFPTTKGMTLLIDAGANSDNKPWHLVQFAAMGSIYIKSVLGKKNPTVGILSIGEEETKGNNLTIETIPLLKNAGLNFYGPIEGRDLPVGLTDVVVTDGFVGNIALKLSEGMAKAIFEILKKEIKSKFIYKVGAMLMKRVFTGLKKKMNPDEFGGAPLLGVNGVVIICHGKTNPTAIFNAIKVAGNLASANIVESIAKNMELLKEKISDIPSEKEKSETI
ncbi:MAG: phosphate acyltransferase PlsX [Elusimicrobiales bacterium]|nr:phosphate acyltransferase PlsX [Elusimicrobiales bacterium]